MGSILEYLPCRLVFCFLLDVLSLLLFSCQGMSDSLWPHGLQHARPPCPTPSPRMYPSSCPLNQWCSAAISSSVQFSSVSQSCLSLCDPVNCSTPGLPVHHQLLEFTHTHVRWVADAIQLSHPLPSPSPPVFSLSQHQGLFQWISSSHQVAKVLEFQLQHQFVQWIFRTHNL